MIFELTEDDQSWAIRHDGRVLAKYTSNPQVPQQQAPKPFLHPVCTLVGNLVTAHRPDDHPWHLGIAWAFTYIEELNFWGGPTYCRETETYELCSNHGRQRHVNWLVRDSFHQNELREEVEWTSAAGAVLLSETRRIGAEVISPRCWRLRFDSEFVNQSGKDISLTSPVCRGREEGGYFGLMWRGSAAWANGQVFGDGEFDGNLMGKRSQWLAYTQTGVGGKAATLVFIDHPSNPRYPTQWFERHGVTPLVTFALAYSEPFTVRDQSALQLHYDILIADGLLSPKEIKGLVELGKPL